MMMSRGIRPCRIHAMHIFRSKAVSSGLREKREAPDHPTIFNYLIEALERRSIL